MQMMAVRLMPLSEPLLTVLELSLRMEPGLNDCWLAELLPGDTMLPAVESDDDHELDADDELSELLEFEFEAECEAESDETVELLLSVNASEPPAMTEPGLNSLSWC